jgi:hypothetical protein
LPLSDTRIDDRKQGVSGNFELNDSENTTKIVENSLEITSDS